MKIQFSKERRSSQHQFDLRKVSRLAQDIDIALHKLTETSSLGTVRSPHVTHLQCLERSRKLVGIVGIISGKRHCQIVTQAGIHKVSFLFRGIKFQFLSSFQDLEDQFLIFSALLAGKILNVFHTGCFD